jgi:tetratricopeptide (TPR) repeat protein
MQQSLEGSVLVIGSRVLPKWAERSAELPVGAMEEEAGKQLAAAAGLPDADCSRLYRAVGGLPGALKVGGALALERGVDAVTKDLKGTAEQIGEELLGDVFAASGEPAQKLWTGLCLLPAPVTREAAQAICQEESFDAAWAELVRRKLMEPGAERAELHPLARAIGQATLSRMSEWSRQCRQHIARFYADSAESIGADRAALDAELENLLAAARLAYEAQEWEALWAMGYSLNTALNYAGRWAAREGLLRLCHEGAQEAHNGRHEAGFGHNLAVLLQNRGQLDEAERLFQQSLEIEREVGGRPGEAISLHQLGMVAQDRGELDEAERLYQQSLQIEQEVGDRPGEAKTLHPLGRVAQDRGELDEAERLYQQSLQIKREVGGRPGEAIPLHQLGRVAQDRGELDEAERLYQQSLQIKREVGDRPGEAISLHQLGMVAQDRGRLDEAECLYQQSLEIARKVGNRPGEAISLAQLALIAEQRGDLRLAVERMQEASAMLAEMGLADKERAAQDLEHLRRRLAEGGRR